MTLRETIAQELLGAIDDPGELDAIFQRYNRSKGPLYLGLADATSELIDRYETLAQESGDLDVDKSHLSGQVAALHDQEIELQEAVQTLASEVQAAERTLEERRAILDRLDQLERSGFGADELSRLSEILAQVSAEQGATPTPEGTRGGD